MPKSRQPNHRSAAASASGSEQPPAPHVLWFGQFASPRTCGPVVRCLCTIQSVDTHHIMCRHATGRPATADKPLGPGMLAARVSAAPTVTPGRKISDCDWLQQSANRRVGPSASNAQRRRDLQLCPWSAWPLARSVCFRLGNDWGVATGLAALPIERADARAFA